MRRIGYACAGAVAVACALAIEASVRLLAPDRLGLWASVRVAFTLLLVLLVAQLPAERRPREDNTFPRQRRSELRRHLERGVRREAD